MEKKFARGNIESVVKIQILRIAERSKHSAEVCRNGLHGERVSHVLFLIRRVQHKVAQRQKGQKSHIVGDKHGSNIGYGNQRGDGGAGRTENFYHLTRENAEKTLVFKRGDDCRHSEKRNQGPKVEIIRILFIGKNEETRNHRRNKGYYGDYIVF